MFEIPEWGEDIPKTNGNFMKSHKANKKKKKNTDNPTKIESPIDNKKDAKKIQNGLTTSNDIQLKTNKIEKKEHIDRLKIKPKKKRKPKQILEANVANARNSQELNKKSDAMVIQNGDIDKPDEMLLNARKQKLNDKLRNDDKEDELFSNVTNDIESNKKNKTKKKRKLKQSPAVNGSNARNGQESKKKSNEIEIQNFDIDKLDEVLVNAKKQKLNDKLRNEDKEDELFSNETSENIKSSNKNKSKKKRKRKSSTVNGANARNSQESNEKLETLDIQNCDKDKPDEILLNAKKQKLNDKLHNEDKEDKLFSNETSENVKSSNKNKLKKKRKRKSLTVNGTNARNSQESKENSEAFDIQNCDIDKPDEILLNARKKKLNDKLRDEDKEDELFSNETDETIQSNNNKTKLNRTAVASGRVTKVREEATTKLNKKKVMIKNMLESYSNRNHISVDGNQLRDRMLERLKAAQFRYLNEKLYTSSGTEAQSLFKSDPMAFQTYHEGYQQQVKKWPVSPLDVIVKKIMKMPKNFLIADMGCGEAALAKRVPQKVRSFDLVATSELVEACDMAHTPLLSNSVDVAVYCLALMGTDLIQYLMEANRVLKVGGHLLIAEVESRFDDVEAFTKVVQKLGFNLKDLDKSHQVFFFIHFTKTKEPPTKKSKLPDLTLKPCLYKRR
ncbi:ribosomal RNA-processing protein 8-like [Battus philenor]|uniref:ribosomal RNA-processing protein 8-like n=1 Tax=Battus philenor TaxID=42288 RepID=UPI0035CE9DF8